MLHGDRDEWANKLSKHLYAYTISLFLWQCYPPHKPRFVLKHETIVLIVIARETNAVSRFSNMKLQLIQCWKNTLLRLYQRSSPPVLEFWSNAQFGDFQAQRHLIQLASSTGMDDLSYIPPLH